MNASEECSHCGGEAKCRRRDFSEQAWSALLVWGEIVAAVVDQPICEECYAELRDVLIDRADEIGNVGKEPAQPQRPAAVSGLAKAAPKRAEAARPKVRKAG